MLIRRAKSRVAVEVNWEVRDLMKVAASQAATHLSEFRATEALVEARTAYRDKFRAALDAGRFDAILCPPTSLPALLHGDRRQGVCRQLTGRPAPLRGPQRPAHGRVHLRPAQAPAGRGHGGHRGVMADHPEAESGARGHRAG